MGQRRRRARGKGVGSGLSGVPADGPRRVLDVSEAEQYCSEPSPLRQVERAFHELEPGSLLEVRSRVTEHAFAVRTWARRRQITVVRDGRDGVMHVVVLRR